MIKGIVSSLLISTLMISATSSASELYYRPAVDSSTVFGNNWTFSGAGSLQRSLNFSCDIEVKLIGSSSAPDGHGSFSHTDESDVTGAVFRFVEGDTPLCANIGVPYNTSSGPVTYDPVSGTINFANTKITTLTLGYCEGTLTGNLNTSTNVITFAGTLPGFLPDGTPTPSLPCVFSGTLFLDAPTGGTIEPHPHDHSHPHS